MIGALLCALISIYGFVVGASMWGDVPDATDLTNPDVATMDTYFGVGVIFLLAAIAFAGIHQEFRRIGQRLY